MNFAIYDDSGAILRVGSCPDSAVERQYDPQAGEHLYRGSATLDDHVNPNSGKLMPSRGRRPSQNHTWDAAAAAWVLSLDSYKKQKRLEIVRERDRRIFAPISYDALLLDADKRAQDNIRNKRNELQDVANDLASEYPELLMWRDYDNQTHLFDDVPQMIEWLAGLSANISRRGTLAYAWSWRAKEALEEATTAEEADAALSVL